MQRVNNIKVEKIINLSKIFNSNQFMQKYSNFKLNF